MSNIKNNTLVLDSLDRNWLGEDKTFGYKFNLNNGNNSLGEYNRFYKNVQEIYIEYVIMPNIFINIEDLHCSKKLGLLPEKNGELLVNNLIFPKLSDLKYLVMNIDEIKSDIDGTNNSINKSSAIFLLDSFICRSNMSSMKLKSVLNGTDIQGYMDNNLLNTGEGLMHNNINQFVIFKNISHTSQRVNLNLKSLRISFLNPNGKRLSLMNDSLSFKNINSTKFTLTATLNNKVITTSDTKVRTGLFISDSVSELNDINTVIYKKDSSNYTLNKTTKGNGGNVSLIFESRKIEIECNEYFSSEEYRIGDTLIFKNINNVNSNLISFLKREGGHVIVGLRKTNSSSSLYNIVEILPEIEIDLTTGEEILNYYGLNDTITSLELSGRAINKDNQHLIGINIKSE